MVTAVIFIAGPSCPSPGEGNLIAKRNLPVELTARYRVCCYWSA